MKQLKSLGKAKKAKMIREINVSDRQRNLLIKILRDVKQELEEDNVKVLERNKHKSNYLEMLNGNSKTILDVESLLKKLE